MWTGSRKASFFLDGHHEPAIILMSAGFDAVLKRTEIEDVNGSLSDTPTTFDKERI